MSVSVGLVILFLGIDPKKIIQMRAKLHEQIKFIVSCFPTVKTKMVQNRKPGSRGRAGAGWGVRVVQCSGVSNAVLLGRSSLSVHIRDREQVAVSSSPYNLTKVTVKNKEVCL